jgi:3-phosphoshikimate 1-carboxyvinyltransferase
MGANISIENENEICGEKFGDIIIQSSKLKNVKIKQDLIPNIIDEIPILSVAGFFAEGDFEVRGAKELRVKESDRIKAMVENFRKVGIAAEEFEDGFAIRKEKSKIKKEKIIFESYDDHRIAMSFAVFSSCFESEGEVESFDCVKISNPYFLTQMKNIAG